MRFLDNKEDAVTAHANEKPSTPVSSSAEPVEYGTITNVKNRFGFSLKVNQEASSFAATPNASNADFDPTPPSKRTWGSAAFFAYWMV
jgi:NCS1 family nucleobase:cation symporter-1